MQLRGHLTRQGHTLKAMLNRSDDAVIGMVAGRCEWCGQTHIYGEKLDQLIAAGMCWPARAFTCTGAQKPGPVILEGSHWKPISYRQVAELKGY